MMNKSTGIFLVVLIGSLMATVSGHRKNKDRKLSGIHHHLLGTRGERCPLGTKLVFSSSSTDLLTRNFSAKCEPLNAEMSSPFRSSNSLIQSNTAFDVPNFQQSSAAFQPSDIFRPFPGIILPSGHQSTGFRNRAALSTELLLRERGLHKIMLSKLDRHSHKHRQNKSKF